MIPKHIIVHLHTLAHFAPQTNSSLKNTRTKNSKMEQRELKIYPGCATIFDRNWEASHSPYPAPLLTPGSRLGNSSTLGNVPRRKHEARLSIDCKTLLRFPGWWAVVVGPIDNICGFICELAVQTRVGPSNHDGLLLCHGHFCVTFVLNFCMGLDFLIVKTSQNAFISLHTNNNARKSLSLPCISYSPATSMSCIKTRHSLCGQAKRPSIVHIGTSYGCFLYTCSY